jgi:REP element-mobilizing transposase RayT
MARTARQVSETGIYHIMFRGINQSQLFYDDIDRQAFLERLGRFKCETAVSVFAYALMDNHVHLLIKAESEQLPRFAKKLQLSYSHWFGLTYERSGYLFQGRYKSEAVQTERHLLATVCYIHQNPVKIGKPPNYWTSYDAYMGTGTDPVPVDTALVLDMLGSTREQARGEFKELVAREASDDASPFDRMPPRRVADGEAQMLIKRLGGVLHCQDVCSLPKEPRDAVFVGLMRKGCSVRQIARLTGANRGIVHRAWKEARRESGR